jgi:tagatose-6-phosphate ketose/aldose isomerase
MPSSFAYPLAPALGSLRAAPVEEQQSAGYADTLREICQQPELWMVTANQIAGVMAEWRSLLAGVRGIVLTGSGSSSYLGDCVRLAVQAGTGISTVSRPSGELLLFGAGALPAERPLLLVSFARSGNSPESEGLIRRLLECAPEVAHLVVTCNLHGRVARALAANGHSAAPGVHLVTLDDRTCDRSLVMTSSFTNMAVAALGLAASDRPADYVASAALLAGAGAELLSEWAGALAALAGRRFDRMIALGDGGGYGAAREAALKMLEMTEGRVATLAETSLGFRHGPMCALTGGTLLVMFLSSEPLRRAYQTDLLKEIHRKGLGGSKLVVGAEAPREFLGERDVAIEIPGLASLADEWAAIAFVVAGQLLSFFRCRAEGLQPDHPAANGAISRVVSEFPLHGIAS